MGTTIGMALRNFRKHTFFTLIHMSGLAIGISAALVIYLIVQYEFSYEKDMPDRDRIYRVVTRIDFPDMTIHNSGVPVPTAAALRAEGTGIESVTHFMTTPQMKVSVPQGSELPPAVFRKQEHVAYADEAYFTLFSYTWLAGSNIVALKEPFRVVLTESRARQYFASMPFPDMLGKTLFYNDSIKAVVAGVVKDPGYNTDLHFKEFISLATIPATGLRNHWNWEEWGSINSSSQLFIKTLPGSDTGSIAKQLAALRARHRTVRPGEEKDDTRHFLQPMADLHFNPVYDAMEQRQANRKVLWGLLTVAAFLLLLGCINFVNLSTAQAGQRAKEIGIRKTLGSSRKQLIYQFLGETAVLTVLATLVSVMITPWLLNVFKDFIPPGIAFSSLNQVHVWVFLCGMIATVTLLSGFYPALVLTRFRPITVMKNQAHGGRGQTRKSYLRKTLTVTQFVIAQFLIIATLALSKQIHFSLTKDLGYKKDAIVYFSVPWNFFSDKPDSRRLVLVEKLKSIPELTTVALAGSPPASFNYSTSTMSYDNGSKKLESMVEQKTGDSAYFKLYGLQLVAGKYMQSSDTVKEYVINETFSKFLGFNNPQDAVGITINRGVGIPVTGVVKDFHARSTRDQIKPLAYGAATDDSYTIHLGLAPRGNDPDTWNRALKKTKAAFKEVYPEEDFSYTFFDASIATFYEAEQNLLRLLKWAAGLCIFISCLGLLGLVIFTTHSRTKEIGVRKVLGASVGQIVGLLSKDFVMLVVIAFSIAAPAAWWFMHDWLQDFAYRTPLSWWLFAACGLGMLLLALAILSIRTIQAAVDNPVHSLRTE
jgi:putative ABC transport system permease protein